MDAAIEAAQKESPGRKPAVEILPAKDYWLAEDVSPRFQPHTCCLLIVLLAIFAHCSSRAEHKISFWHHFIK